MIKNFSEAGYVKHMNRIMEGELWELVGTGRVNANNDGVVDGVMDCDSIEYSSHTLADAVNKENRYYWILVKRSMNDK